ncbi:MAG: HD domain-containing protein [Coriobacteriia bacterium]|nr:HD domain-containing protein [Coriobacteriia bacterium]
MAGLRETNRRELQLDAISSLLIIAMAAVVGLLLYFLSSNGIALPATLPLANYLERILLSAFVLLVVAYLWDQRRRLRTQVNSALSEAETARSELDQTVQYLAFSHQAASRLGDAGVEESLQVVLQDATTLFKADAAAVLGEDDEHVFIADDAPVAEAERALTHVALVAAGKGTPLHIQSLGTEEGQAIAVPLRVQGELRYVLALWKRTAVFHEDQLDALGLMGRMVELAMEREESLKEAQDQLEGTLRVLQYLVADKRPDYSRHAVGVAELASSIGQRLGLPPQTRKQLRLAGLVHDVGMMNLRDDVADAGHALTEEEWLVVRQHSRVGSEIAKAANFGQMVQDAVAGHHERMDGSGYPLGLKGTEIPMEARVVAVCEVYDSMTHRTYHSSERNLEDAMLELKSGAGTLYDRQVVTALQELVLEDRDLQTVEFTPSPVSVP